MIQVAGVYRFWTNSTEALNISVATVQKWEQGRPIPSRPSLKLLNWVDARGLDALDLSNRARIP